MTTEIRVADLLQRAALIIETEREVFTCLAVEMAMRELTAGWDTSEELVLKAVDVWLRLALGGSYVPDCNYNEDILQAQFERKFEVARAQRVNRLRACAERAAKADAVVTL